MSKALLLNFGQKILQATTRSIPKVENKLLEVQTKLGRRALGNPSQITNEFKPIMPTELKTIKQMAKFNKTAFGVKVYGVFLFFMLKYLNIKNCKKYYCM